MRQYRRIVRDAIASDADACAKIYGWYVTATAITFETEPPSPTVMAERIRVSRRGHAFLVLCEGDAVVGFAYGAPFKDRPAYRWSCEVSVYLDPERRGTGGGRMLYEELFEQLTARGFRTAVAGIALPNEASVRLHAALGFEPAGIYRAIGWKHGAWHDVAWLQRDLPAALIPHQSRHDRKRGGA